MTLHVQGRVQGVGFRPYVYTLAQECNVKGYVCNDAQGVAMALEGSHGHVDTFLERLEKELPPLARIDSMVMESCDWVGYLTFDIRQSQVQTSKCAVISPDMAVCADCLQEMHTTTDRRSGYWLINCTHCGPRYSIIRTIPYDRPHTSMAAFHMCQSCHDEYQNALNRRYHAQPISCYTCGPTLTYEDHEIALEGEAAFQGAIRGLKAGHIIAVKGLGGFHLMCDATREASVALLRQRKQRPGKPFAVMFPSIEQINVVAHLCDAEIEQITSRERPVVLVTSIGHDYLAPSVAPNINRLGVMLPYTPLHYRLCEELGVPLVATSANLSDAPILRSEEAIQAKFSEVVDGILSHNREIVNACDDSVLQVLDKRPLMLRMARGFTPYTWKRSSTSNKRILAVGAQQKNSIALAFEDHIVLSPHIGDLGTLEAFDYFERTLETFKGLYGFEADLIVCDKHPDYDTTRWAKAQGVPVLEVQHHYAHIMAVMAEYELEGRVLGFAFDGTGYGDDGKIWGGEVFLADTQGYERVFSLAPFPLLGGERAVREPRRIALGMLFMSYPLEVILEMDVPTVQSFSESEIRLLHQGWRQGINAPLTSSMGRLFDGVASLAGVCQTVSYEGESGLILETVGNDTTALPFDITLVEGCIDWKPMLEHIFMEEQSTVIASRFLATVVEMIVQIASQYDYPVVLGGGVFQNQHLLQQVSARCKVEGMAYVIPSKFPINDGGIALGQLHVALCQERV